MNAKLIKQDKELIEETRHAVSRHQEIPPTPRDTMAVLMQAAESESAKPAWNFPSLRWIAANSAAVLVVAAALFFLTNDKELTSTQASPIDDLGLDVAAWDMEIESLLDDLDESFAALSTDDYSTMGF